MARTKNKDKGKYNKGVDRKVNGNLMNLIEESTNSGERTEGGPQKNISRKDLRKNQRKLKKLKKQAHQLKKQGKLEQILPTTNTSVNKSLNGTKKKLNTSSLSTQNDSTPKSDTLVRSKMKPHQKKSKKNPTQQQEILQKEQKQQRVKQLKIANRLEDKNIKKIEKQLKMNKRKTKSIPKSFVDDGLDFLLEVCDPEKRSALAHEEFDFADNDAGFEDDLALLNAKEVKTKPKKSSTIAKNDEELSAEEDDEDMSDCGESNTDADSDEDLSDEEEDAESDLEMEEGGESVNSDGLEVSDADENSSAESSPEDVKDENQDGCWEDIYGRLRDKGGKVVDTKSQQASTGKYVPPGKRLQDAAGSSTSVEMEKLKRQMKGFFNRLAEANLPGIVSSIEQLYLTNSRHSMQEAINTLILDSLVTPVLSPERLIMEHCVLVAALHANIGTEVGAQFLEVVVRRFHALYEDSESQGEDKMMDNLILILSHLYNFGLIAAPLLTGILVKLAERFSEKDIELILIVLRSVGFALRKDDPIALKQIILSLQTKAGQIANQPNRVRFMLDVLLAIRNNNVAKIPNYDPSHSEHLRKILRNSLIRKSASLSKMNITYNELLAADRRGRWWVVGSAWVGQGPAVAEGTLEDTDQVGGKEMQFSAELLEMARKQRMNTDIRRNIFCILMTAEDFLEANERLLRLNLKSQQEREIIHVAIDCCLHEKSFNPYYVHVVQKFCHLHRRFQIATQFALWDRFKDLSALTTLQVAHLAKLLVQLISDGALYLSVLKVIQFTEMDRILVRFLRQILLGLLLHPSETAVLSAFQRVSSTKHYLLKEGLTLFIHHFLLKNVDKMELHDAEKLKQRVHLAEQVLNLGLK